MLDTLSFTVKTGTPQLDYFLSSGTVRTLWFSEFIVSVILSSYKESEVAF